VAQGKNVGAVLVHLFLFLPISLFIYAQAVYERGKPTHARSQSLLQLLERDASSYGFRPLIVIARL
jgi:hypothetical protein